MHPPDDGTITYLGDTVSLASPRAAWDIGISTIFQEIKLVPLMSVARNLFLGHEPRTRWRLLDVDTMNRQADALLRRYGIDVDVRRPVVSFGAGVQQMIAIVRAVSTDARVVIIDEPTSSLEPPEVARSSRRSVACAPRASPCSSSATTSTRCSRSPTGSRSCATGAGRAPAPSPTRPSSR